jgi:hypothetical protein
LNGLHASERFSPDDSLGVPLQTVDVRYVADA